MAHAQNPLPDDVFKGRVSNDPSVLDLCHLCDTLNSRGIYFSSTSEFNQVCRDIVRKWDLRIQGAASSSASNASHFPRLMDRISKKYSDTITTPWGGVDVLRYDHPYVEKYLVVSGSKYLAFEYHMEKREELFMLEGDAIVLVCPDESSPIVARPFTKSSNVYYAPGVKHGLVALADTVVFERSIDPKGMDKDLCFEFLPE